MSDLDDILDETPPPAAAPAPVAEEAPPAAASPLPEGSKDADRAPDSAKRQLREKELVAQEEGRGNVRDPETGKFVPRETKPAEAAPTATPAIAAPAAPQQPLTDKEMAFYRRAEDERGKRQELERRLAAAEAKLNPPAPRPDPTVDAPAWAEHVERSVDARITTVRLDTAEAIARSRYPDFQEKANIFVQMVGADPSLNQRMISASDPAEFAYQTAKAALERHQWEQAGGADGMRAKIAAEERAKVEAEYKAKSDAAAKLRSNLPGSLSDVQGAATARAAWTGPPPLDDILH